MHETATVLTIVSLALGITSAIGVGIWKITRYLNDLSELPDDVKDVARELRKMRRESRDWRADHMRGHAAPTMNHQGERGPLTG